MQQHMGRVRAELSEELEMAVHSDAAKPSIIFAVSLQAAAGKSSLTGKLTPVLCRAASADRVCLPADLPLTAGHTSPILPVIRTNYSQGRESCDHSMNLF